MQTEKKQRQEETSFIKKGEKKMKDSKKIHDLIKNTFEKHQVNDIALQNALIEIFEETLLSKEDTNDSSDVLSEKMRDKPDKE